MSPHEPNPQTLHDRAIAVVRHYLRHRGYAVRRAPASAPRPGCDLIATRGRESLTFLVKFSCRAWTIPDLAPTEFDGEKRLVADYLCVVYLSGRYEPRLCAIPRDAIKPCHVLGGGSYRLTTRLQKEAALKPFLKRI